ncbi:MAG: hypothetical protein ACK4Z4_00910 [Ferrovibrio sp.]
MVRQSGKIRQKRHFSGPALQGADGDKAVVFQVYAVDFHRLSAHLPPRAHSCLARTAEGVASDLARGDSQWPQKDSGQGRKMVNQPLDGLPSLT